MRSLISALLLFAFGSFASGAPVPKEILKKFPDYYPLLPGTEWEYAIGEGAVTVKVQDYEKKDGVRTGTLATFVNGKVVATEKIRVDETGVYRTHINKTELEPPILILKFGIKDETEWTTKAKAGEAKVDFTFKLNGLEEREVPAGKYNAVKVSGAGDAAGIKTHFVYHFADGVGIVRLCYELNGATVEMALKKFTPGKEEKK